MQRHTDAETYKVIPKSLLPAGIKPIQAIWSFRRKCLPNWMISKWKACLFPHGCQDINCSCLFPHGFQDINYWEMYALVVTSSTMHLVLILSLLLGLASCQVDYIQAYMQSPLDCDLYMHVLAPMTWCWISLMANAWIVMIVTTFWNWERTSTDLSRQEITGSASFKWGFIEQRI